MRLRSKLSQLIHSGATSCAALTMPRWKEARRRLAARPSIRKSLCSNVCIPSAFSILILEEFYHWSLCRRVHGVHVLFALSGDVLDLQVPYAPQIDPAPPAVVSEPDECIVAARAADDGAKPPHLVDHRRPDPIGPSATLAGVIRGGCLEGEDLPEGAGRGVPVQPELVHNSLTSSGSEAFGLHARGVVPQAHQRVRRPLHERGGAAHEGEWTLVRGTCYLPKHRGVDAPVVAAPTL